MSNKIGNREFLNEFKICITSSMDMLHKIVECAVDHDNDRFYSTKEVSSQQEPSENDPYEFDDEEVIFQNQRNYIIYSDFSIYLKLILKQLLDDSEVISIVSQQPFTISKQQQQPIRNNDFDNESLLITANSIRFEIELMKHYDETFRLESMSFDHYVQNVPKLLLNFIKLCTMSKSDYKKYLDQNNVIDFATNEVTCDPTKQLKQLSICFDVMSCRERTNFNPKHSLLAISLYKLTGSRRAVELCNKFGIVL
ncbi:unnamed protein product [Didymodactylos carnosus]|uniref:Uncharacterized protein n=1 Tax=Didymodactylos carnosus TaxID=1234261 RepID=A0A815K171_9BILA|nr:unnamed protein product [Didymodactylos carnosus]CAF1385060.1 unnamed protein product [Didymodactylos carnosus]CAF4041363.1 unnamed protein product [Didymodactylos carnosus]CAF4280244.1 unnamed protein product [Didymodactylos carnosus]